ncbi:hypothetical protein [Aquitalea magnusonii]|uniref:hypothetical protein n=1 Tax=Aquitalea magnusonii TaxID=332411 RepID=UPI0011AE9854|nr:hypothetical protein [Aquitalea magnusonii]
MDMQPQKPLIDWLLSIDREECVDILFLSFHSSDKFLTDFPRFENSSEVESFLLKVSDWIDLAEDSYFERLGRILAVKSAIEYIVAIRSNLSTWKDALQRNQAMLQEATSSANSPLANSVDMLTNLAAKIPEREAKWKVIGPSWAVLVENYLSHEKLENWSFSAMSHKHTH